MKKSNVKELLELGCGQGRDSIFLASNGINVRTFDQSKVAVDAVISHTKNNSLPLTAITHDAREGLPYADEEFGVVYSHMFFSMRFTRAELKFLFNEVRRVLAPNGLHFFSVRSDKDAFYGKGRHIEDGVYDVNGFEIRFFSRKEVIDLAEGLEIEQIVEDALNSLKRDLQRWKDAHL